MISTEEISPCSLYGFPLSNYFNKVKFVLLEHGIAFEEVRTNFGQNAATSACSRSARCCTSRPMWPLAESQVIVEYLAAAHPDKVIFSPDPYRAAKERELAIFIDLHRTRCPRPVPLPSSAASVTDYTKSRAALLNRNVAGFARIAKSDPYVGGTAFIADVCVFVSLPLVGLATVRGVRRDFLLEAGIDWKTHGERLANGPPRKRSRRTALLIWKRRRRRARAR